MNIIKQLSSLGHEITLLINSKTDLPESGRSYIEAYVDRVIVCKRRKLLSLKNMFLYAFGTKPLLAIVNGYSTDVRNKFIELLRERWDIIQIEHSYACQPYLDVLHSHNLPYIVTEHNIESNIAIDTYNRIPAYLRWIFIFDIYKYKAWEKKVFRGAAQVLAVSRSDKKYFSSIAETPIEVIPNGVDVDTYTPVKIAEDCKRILFVGNYEYAPNVDAVEWTLQEIMPRVWSSCPEARFAICGYGLPERWKEQYSDSRIEWVGYVDDLPQMQASSCVFLAPLRDGGGSKLKVLEAMAAALPLVSTAQGVSGLQLQNGLDAFVDDSPNGLADHVIELLNNKSLARVMGQAGRTYVSNHHDWKAIGKQLEHVYQNHLVEGDMQT